MTGLHELLEPSHKGLARRLQIPLIVESSCRWSPSVRGPGKIEGPLAVVILGGLVSSTLMNVFAMPCAYLLRGRSHPDAKPRT